MRRPLSLAVSSQLTHVARTDTMLTPLMLFEEWSFADRDSFAIIKAENPRKDREAVSDGEAEEETAFGPKSPNDLHKQTIQDNF